MYPFSRPYYIPLVFNMRHPILRNVEVRRAINEAFDRDALVRDGLRGQGAPADGPVWPQHWAYLPPPQQPLKFEPAFGAHAPRRRRLTCSSPARNAACRSVSASSASCSATTRALSDWRSLAQKQLADIGIDMQLEPLTLDTLAPRINCGEFRCLHPRNVRRAAQPRLRFLALLVKGSMINTGLPFRRRRARPAPRPRNRTTRHGPRWRHCCGSCTTIHRRRFSHGRRRLAPSRPASTWRRSPIAISSPTLWMWRPATPQHADLAVRRITSRFVLLIATAAVLPLVVYGAVSIRSLRGGTYGSVQGRQRQGRQTSGRAGQPVHAAEHQRAAGGRRRARCDRVDAVPAGTSPQGLRAAIPGLPGNHGLRQQPPRRSPPARVGKTRLKIPEEARTPAGQAVHGPASKSTTTSCRRRRSPCA